MNWLRQIFKKNRINGQALVEVLLAMSILVSTFIGLLSVQLQSSDWMAESRALTRAGMLAFSLLEALRGGSLSLDWELFGHNEWVALKQTGGSFPLTIIKGQDVYIQLHREENGVYQAGVRVEWQRRDEKSSVVLYSKIRETSLKGSSEQPGSGAN